MTPGVPRPDGPTDVPAPEGIRLDDSLRWRLATQAAGVGSFDWNLLTDELRWDDELMQIWGYTDDTFVPHIDSFWTRVHPDDQPVLSEAIERSKNELVQVFCCFQQSGPRFKCGFRPLKIILVCKGGIGPPFTA